MTVTDHSKAHLDDAHSHGVVVPASSRAERRTSFDPADFPMPTGREEEWRFTPLDRLGATLDDAPIERTPVLTLDTLPAGVVVTQITAAEARERSVRAPSDRAGAIAASRALRGMLMSVAPGAIVSRPVEFGVPLREGAFRTHFVLEVGEGAEVTLVARYRGVAEISEFFSFDIAPRARLNFVLVDECSLAAVHLTDLVVRVGEGAQVRGSVVTLGSGVVRKNVSIELAGEESEVDLYGIYLARSGEHVEHRTFIDHVAPRCRSRVTYKGALDGETARTVWIGDVLIRAEAEGTDTYEVNRNLVLSDGARADSVPNLEIETGEIEGAGHASATGRFDDEQLFYLRSRGIPEAEARRLVVRGFFADVIHKIGVPRIEKALTRVIENELESIDD